MITKMPEEVTTLYAVVQAAHSQCHVLLNAIDDKIKTSASQTDEELTANIAYALREASVLADDTRKRIDGLCELAQKVTCLVSITKGQTDPIRTSHVTATPDIKLIATLPKMSNNPEAYKKIMEYIGVKPEFLQDDSGEECVRLHFPGVSGLISKLAAAGRPLPPGLSADKTYPQYRLIMRKKKGVLE